GRKYACVVLLPPKVKCSEPFGKNLPCDSCRKYAAECVFSDRRKPGPVPKRADGAPASLRVRSTAQGRSAGGT
ncbi:unnamed protein product, partial [Ectocarpus fasciculatus]